jgi:DNA-binding transcriptional ArsR family regulator
MAGASAGGGRRANGFDERRIVDTPRAVVRFVFTVEDLARTRFAISPMWELVRSLVALRDPSTAALHLPWLRSLSGRLGGIALEPAVALIPPRGYSPDFLTPPPAGPLGDIEEDLAALRATPLEQIRHDIGRFRFRHPPARVARAWLADPAREVALLAETMEAYWRAAVAPVWPRIRAFLEADIAHRARRLAEAGPEALFAGLHPAIAWSGERMEVGIGYDATIELAGRGLLLMPSAFTWARPATIDLAPWQPTVIYPARGIATLWEEGRRSPAALSRLLGATRAAVLADLEAPRSTTELARRLSLSPAGASHHLTALRDAGLVTSRRDGRSILYVRTATADALLAS